MRCMRWRCRARSCSSSRRRPTAARKVRRVAPPSPPAPPPALAPATIPASAGGRRCRSCRAGSSWQAQARRRRHRPLLECLPSTPDIRRQQDQARGHSCAVAAVARHHLRAGGAQHTRSGGKIDPAKTAAKLAKIGALLDDNGSSYYEFHAAAAAAGEDHAYVKGTGVFVRRRSARRRSLLAARLGRRRPRLLLAAPGGTAGWLLLADADPEDA